MHENLLSKNIVKKNKDSCQKMIIIPESQNKLLGVFMCEMETGSSTQVFTLNLKSQNT